MTGYLAAFSDTVASLVASAAPLLCAIRTAPNRHMTGMLFHGDAIVTVDQGLPALDCCTVVLPDRSVASARPGPRDPSSNLALLRLDTPVAVPRPEHATAYLGNLVISFGAESDASPTVRLGVVHRMTRTPDGPACVLDLTAADQGGPVLDAYGRLIGLLTLGAANEAIVVPVAALNRLSGRVEAPGSARQVIGPFTASDGGAQPPAQGKRGWLGVALQPITVPDQLVQRAGQMSGRMVVNITTGGPADKAGLRVGDVLLALNGISTTGPHALRAFLGTDRIGSSVEVKLLRDGSVLTTHLVVGAQ